MLLQVFKRPQKARFFYESLLKEIEELGLKSLGIIMFISFFIGGVIALQTALNVDSPFIPKALIGFATKRSIILEFAPTFCSIILAGKVGSYITSSIGTIRVTEQIDALVIMGVNAPGYLILPKIVAAVFILPFLVVISMFLGVSSGYLVSLYSGLLDPSEYIYGISYDFIPFSVTYALIKTLFFAFAIT